MAIVAPKTDFDFQTLDKGIYVVKVAESGIDAPRQDKPALGRRFWARLQVVGGSQDGLSHTEGFYENTNDNFSLIKLFGFLMVLGVLKKAAGFDTDMVKTQQFIEKWQNGLKNREMGIKVKHRYADNDISKQTPYSDVSKYMTKDEALAQIGGKPAAAVPPPATPPAPADAPAPAAPATPPVDLDANWA